MKLSSSFVAPSAAAILSIALLCDPAASQTTAGPASQLPNITIEAAKPVARPHRAGPERVANTAGSRRTSSAAQTPSPAPNSVLGRIARLEKASSSCNGGCETSVKTGNAPWVGCSESGGHFSTFSATCRDTLTYTSYADCKDTRMFLGLDPNRAWWLCTSLMAGKKFQVAELKRSKGQR